MEVKELALIENDAPPPLSPLRDVVVSPANIAAEARIQRAKTMSRGDRKRARARLKQLASELERDGYRDVITLKRVLQPQVSEYRAQWYELKEQLQSQPDSQELKEKRAALQLQITPLQNQWNQLQTRLRSFQPVVKERRELLSRLEEHTLAVARIKAERKLRDDMAKEAKIYEKLVIDKWNRLGFCHRYSDTKGKWRTNSVSFAQVGITLDAIYYKIDASQRTMFGNFKTNLPDGVYVADQLLHEKTLTELSITCQRQVSGVYNTNGAWVVVNRLESVDGLMNYVSYEDVIGRYPKDHHERFPICVGVGANRAVQWLNLVDFPHWLIAGYTNSGKSNMVNVGICTLITQHDPDDLQLVLIDLKGGLEFSFYSGIPHLHGQIVDEVQGVATALKQLEAIMVKRQARIRAGRAKDINELHAKGGERMTRIVCVFDEVASIMDHGETTKEIMDSLRNLTRLGRAMGIHIWLCTQRPDVRAIEGSVKINLAVRITGRMATAADSLTVLGNSSAKDLAAVPGRMMLQLGPDPTPVQTPHISADMVNNALAIAMSKPEPKHKIADEIPEGVGATVHQIWDVERIIELSIVHLGGNITAHALYKAADGLTQSQSRKLAEQVWSMKEIVWNGSTYKVETGRSNTRKLVKIA